MINGKQPRKTQTTHNSEISMSKETHEELYIDLIRVHNGVETRYYEWVLNIPENTKYSLSSIVAVL